jgi:hypothetical protein
MPSLWRNNVLLGRIVAFPSSGDGRIFGLLDPTPEIAGVEPMMQYRAPELPNAPTYQHITTRLEMKLGDFEDASGRRKPLRPIQIPPGALDYPEEMPDFKPEDFPPGVPADQLLEIRSDDGTVLSFGSITLSCATLPDKYRENMRQEMGLRGDGNETWTLMASD